MLALGIVAAVLAAAAVGQAVRIGLKHGDWMAVKLLVGFALFAIVLLLVSRVPVGD
jgi:hypothetical protein